MCIDYIIERLVAPFGPEFSDNILNRGQYANSRILTLSPAFPYFGVNMTSFSVNSNGFITFLNPCNASTCFSVRDIPFVSPPLIATLWKDYSLEIDNAGDVFYRIATDESSLNATRDYVYAERLEQFDPSYAIIVTWYRLPQRYATMNLENNTFQAILTTDGYRSYVLFSYGELQASGGAEVGFNFGDGLSYLSVASQSRLDSFEIETRTNLRQNDNSEGRRLYRVDGMTE